MVDPDDLPLFRTPGAATSAACSAAEIARDVLIVIGHALAPNEEELGPTLLEALRTVASLGEEYATNAAQAAEAASRMLDAAR